jgi:pimeloyl-ACP methyl ester carboxylesterase
MQLPPLILIHGYPFDHTMWKFVVAKLETKTQVITPDLPGFGDNPVEIAEPSIDVMADDIADLFEFHKIRHAVVAGMSMGGYVALAFAQRHAERVAGLGLISTQATADPDEVKESRRTLIKKIQREGTQPALETLLPKIFSQANQNNSVLIRFPIRGVENAGVEGICWALEAMARRPDRTAMLGTVECPVLVLHGSEDKIIPAEKARQLSETIPDANYVEVAGAGHASPLETPEAVADALLDLLIRSKKFRHHTPKRDEHAENLPGVVWAPSERGL